MSIAIRIENVSKLYRLGEVGTGSLAHDINRWWHRLRGKDDPYSRVAESNDRTVAGGSEYVWALKDVSFDIQEGQIVGIIGRNGAGKSTLLKILSRVTTPTQGSLKIRGRIASLLEVGTGFHPELTGRENIYLNGAILGMRKHEITRRLDEIIDFSGCERYIDTPVKRYSSGMYVRLAFAVAAHIDTEIMVVDEVLAVGDGEFQGKCLGKMHDVAESGRTVIFVSHNLGAVRQLCDEVSLIENGTVAFKGDVSEGLSRHESSFALSNGNVNTKFHGPLSKSLQFEKMAYYQDGSEVAACDALKEVTIELSGFCNERFTRMEIDLVFFRDGLLLGSCFDCLSPSDIHVGPFLCRFIIPPGVLRPGRYTLSVGSLAGIAQWAWGADVAVLDISENCGDLPKHRVKGVLSIPHSGQRQQ